MATPSASASAAAPATAAQTARIKPERSITERWLFAAFLLAGGAQLITIAGLLSVDPVAASWSALLLAIAPVPLTAAAAFTPLRLARPAVGAAVVVLVIGIITQGANTGPLFIPALAAAVVGGMRLWLASPS
jgi:hypothetical protein